MVDSLVTQARASADTEVVLSIGVDTGVVFS